MSENEFKVWWNGLITGLAGKPPPQSCRAEIAQVLTGKFEAYPLTFPKVDHCHFLVGK